MTQTTAQPELVELTRTEATLGGVAAAALGNLLAGVGVGLVTGTLLHLAGVPAYWKWALYAALIAWGAIMAVWFAQDEARNWLARRELAGDLAAAEDAIQWADEQISHLRYQLGNAQSEAARLRAEVAALRAGKSYVDAQPPADDPTLTDAQTMIDLYHANKVHPSRRMMGVYGWSDDRHKAAQSMLATRGVIAIGRGNVVRWADDTPAASAARLANHDRID